MFVWHLKNPFFPTSKIRKNNYLFSNIPLSVLMIILLFERKINVDDKLKFFSLFWLHNKKIQFSPKRKNHVRCQQKFSSSTFIAGF